MYKNNMAKKSPLQIIGIVLIVIGAFILFSSVFGVEQTFFKVGPIETDVPQGIAIRLVVGVIFVILGLVCYFGKEGLKIFMKK